MNKTQIKPNNVLIRPRVTEKAALQGEKLNVYAFEVTRDATKKSIIASVKEIYKVTPTDVHMVTIPKKNVFVRGKRGVKGGGKKAYVYLKKGDKIETI
jgi:large subunit ribosomal protein L23